MFSTERIERLAPDVMLDIVAELAYWQSCYPYRHFFTHRLPFEAYVTTFKFGYDSFLLHHRQGLAAVMPILQARYQGLPDRDRIEWPQAALIVHAAWQRMTGCAPA